MIKYEKFTLKNGLRCIVHHDTSTPMVAMNVIYDVGARDENPAQTGFAHLFEHLMFGGSINIPDYDEPLQMAGGENNAYTTNDITNYYIQLPAKNIETAFWLESDRMLSLAFSEKSLEVQRKVVCEEFKEHYINKPYGDTWKYLRELCYTQHPYRWMTIGKELAHVIFKAYHIANRLDKKYYAADVITEIFSGGQSSRLHQKLVKEQAIFSQIDCYHTGSVENGLLVIEGKILPFVKPEDADKAIQVEIGLLKNNKISELELEKVKNKIESMIAFEDLSLLSRANNLAFYELLGDAEMMNQELGNYQAVSVDDVIACANEVFSDENTNTLYYLAKNNTQA
ncbi:MAG: insulinase family protein [Bacteroidetes bacterium]|nr:insulinase family protein [Bacteroidota bacterium]